MKNVLLKIVIFAAGIIFGSLLVAPYAYSQEQSELPYNTCLSFPCSLETLAGEMITVDGSFSSTPNTAQMSTVVYDRDHAPQIALTLNLTSTVDTIHANGIVLRSANNIFNLPEWIQPFDVTFPNPIGAQMNLSGMTADHAAITTLLIGLVNVQESIGIDDPPLCQDIIRSALQSSFTLTGFIIIPWFESDASKICAQKHDICYSHATTQDQRNRCDAELLICSMNANPVGFGYHIFSFFGISIGGSFAWSPSEDKCLCDWRESADREADAGFILAKPHTTVHIYQSACCDDKKCLEGRYCSAALKDDAGRTVHMLFGNCIANPLYPSGPPGPGTGGPGPTTGGGGPSAPIPGTSDACGRTTSGQCGGYCPPDKPNCVPMSGTTTSDTAGCHCVKQILY